jgi:hypothetical protein
MFVGDSMNRQFFISVACRLASAATAAGRNYDYAFGARKTEADEKGFCDNWYDHPDGSKNCFYLEADSHFDDDNVMVTYDNIELWSRQRWEVWLRNRAPSNRINRSASAAASPSQPDLYDTDVFVFGFGMFYFPLDFSDYTFAMSGLVHWLATHFTGEVYFQVGSITRSNQSTRVVCFFFHFNHALIR